MTRSVKSICFYVNDRKNRAAEVRDMLAPVAEAAGLEVTADGGAADAVLALGGDGTMLRAVHDALACSGQLSFEARMGCGFGACMGCTMRTVSGYARVCKDGPVLRKEEVLWEG